MSAWISSLTGWLADLQNRRTAMAMTESTRRKRSTRGVMWNAWRLFIAVWFLFGSPMHIYYGLVHPEIYRVFGPTCLFAVWSRWWPRIVVPHATFFALVLAAFEMTVGILILGRGAQVKIGLAASLAFNLFLIVLGLGFPGTIGTAADFVQNRLPNVAFIVIQMPLFWARFEQGLPSLIGDVWRSRRNSMAS